MVAVVTLGARPVGNWRWWRIPGLRTARYFLLIPKKLTAEKILNEQHLVFPNRIPETRPKIERLDLNSRPARLKSFFFTAKKEYLSVFKTNDYGRNKNFLLHEK